MNMITRRSFLTAVSSGVGAAAMLPRSIWAANLGVEVPGKAGMVVRSARFLDLEMAPEFFNSWITPVPHFFVRNHMHEPSTWDADSWNLSISGEVDHPLSLNLAELTRMETHTVTITLECAGNGRAFQQPKVPGVQWQRGAVGTARFSGPRLRDLLQRAGIKATGRHVMFRGRDEVPGKVPPFVRSIPIEKATDPDTLIATQMNGVPLPRHHGFPARALVPGWIGAASCKWLTEIKVLDQEFDGNFMKPGYRMPNHPVSPGGEVNLADTHAATSLGVKSIIAQPTDGSSMKSHSIRIHGAAWAGEAAVTRLQISTDGGTTWSDARLGSQQARYAWRLWDHVWRPQKPGEYTILSRATDDQGRTQPQVAAWNPSGYLYNAVDQVKVHVLA